MKTKFQGHPCLKRFCISSATLMLLMFLFGSAVSASIPKESGSKKTTLTQFTTGGHVVGFEANKVYLASLSHALRLEFLGTKGVMPEAEAEGTSADKGAPPLKRVRYGNLWPGISVSYEGAKGTVLKSTYRVEPGADVGKIQLAYNVPVEVQKDGSLRYSFKNGYMSESVPIAWQEVDGKRIPVPVSFKLSEGKRVGFGVKGYDSRYPLVIDPSYGWHTFYGSSTHDEGCGIALDGSGNVYVTGRSDATWQGDGGANPLHAHSGDYDIFLLKLNSGGVYQWHTFWGSGGWDRPCGIALDGSGNVYVTGHSGASWQGDSGANPLHAHSGGSDIVVLKLNSSGAYQWHTFYGSSGNQYGFGIASDGNGNIYITGISAETWQGDGGTNPLHPYGGDDDLVVLKLNSNGTYQWHTFYGSSNYDEAVGISVDGNGNVYIAGESEGSWQGDGSANPLHPHSGGFSNLAVLKLNGNGAYQWHTFYGDDDAGYGIALDGNGNIYVTGQTWATWQGDGGANPLHPHSGFNNLVVLKLNGNGAYQWHTFYGDRNAGHGIALDGNGNIYIMGISDETWQGDAGVPPLHTHSGGKDIVVLALNNSGVYQWHTFYGSNSSDESVGIAVDGSGNAYVTGYSPGTWQGDGGANPLHAHSGGNDIVVLKLSVPVQQPGEGTIGTEMTITGSGFGIRKGKVLVGNAALKILEWTHVMIRGLLSKALPPGTYDVTVQPKGASAIVLEDPFTVMAPEIDSVEPANGSAGDEIKIQGSYFGTKKGKVTLGGKNCKVLSWTMDAATGESEIRFVVPKRLGSGTNELKVSNGVGSDSVDFTID